MQEPLLHPVVSSYMLQDIPRKLLIQLPSHETQNDCEQPNNRRNRNQLSLSLRPDIQVPENILGHKNDNGFVDLVDLECAVNEQGKVCDAHSDDLNGILRNESVPNQNDVVYEAEDE